MLTAKERAQIKLALGHIKLWPAAYRMGGHDTTVCRVATTALEKLLAYTGEENVNQD